MWAMPLAGIAVAPGRARAAAPSARRANRQQWRKGRTRFHVARLVCRMPSLRKEPGESAGEEAARAIGPVAARQTNQPCQEGDDAGSARCQPQIKAALWVIGRFGLRHQLGQRQPGDPARRKPPSRRASQ
jgi:hypothetical protein